uniref:Uncharacterized protein n=1 Tax=Meloidogyne javanica TaxID=6303 RepID=A0A915LZE8_MELJA
MNVDKNQLDQEKIASNKQGTAYNEFKQSKKYAVGIFEDLIKDENQHILDHLHQQGYHFGIADLSEMAGSFAIFELLGIKKTFNVLPAIILPALYQFLGINIVKQIHERQTIIPARRFPKPGDWVFSTQRECHFKKDRFTANLHENIVDILSTGKYYYDVVSETLANAMNIGDVEQGEFFPNLFKKTSYTFVNQHSYANFKNSPVGGKIVHIGGILVEENEYFRQREQKNVVRIFINSNQN